MDSSTYRAFLPRVRVLRSNTLIAIGIVARAAVLSLAGLFLSLIGGVGLWVCGQLVLAVGIFQWFVILHEAGHGSLFGRASLDRLIGHIASLFCGIPFFCWQHIHQRHHRWTGWKDRDPTTETALPRELSTLERVAMDTAWRYWIPLFCPVYVLHNFWNAPRIFRLFPAPRTRRRFLFSMGLILFAWSIVFTSVPSFLVLQAYGLAFLLVLLAADPLMLSQHAHIEQHLAGEEKVAPFPYAAQDVFTRSLGFSPVVSRHLFMGFDRHEVHHLFPSVPGYRLYELPLSTPNDISCWRWLYLAKKLPGHKLVILTREQSGVWL